MVYTGIARSFENHQINNDNKQLSSLIFNVHQVFKKLLLINVQLQEVIQQFKEH